METSAVPTRSLSSEYLQRAEVPFREPTLAALARLQRAHLATYSFNSVGVILGHDLSLEREALFDRLVTRRRGGYCFEHNKLFREVLHELGFETRLALARVILNRPIEPPLTHRITIVKLGGNDYLVDVGFGPFTPREPLALDREQPASHDGHVYWISRNGDGEYRLWTRMSGEPYLLYRFSLAPHTESDCEMGHFYSHRHPKAVFVNNLVASLIRGGEVRSLRNTGYRRFDAYGFEDTPIEDAASLRRTLGEEFALDVSEEDAERLYARAKIAAAAET